MTPLHGGGVSELKSREYPPLKNWIDTNLYGPETNKYTILNTNRKILVNIPLDL